jgi:hypothetical protein
MLIIPLLELLPIAICPEKFPLAVGVNCTLNTAVCPGFKVIGTVKPELANPAPVIATELIVTGDVPEEVSVIDCSAGELISTVPNGILDAFAVSIALAGPSCTVKVFAIPPAVAVSIADWFVLTLFTEAEKDALIEPNGTITLAGTVTEELLLESDIAKPVSGAVP